VFKNRVLRLEINRVLLIVTRCLWLCLIILGFQHSASGQANAKIIEVRAEPWEYFTYADGTGYFYELLRAVYEPLGYELNFKFCPWRRCILDVIQHKADIVIGVYENEQEVGDQLQTPMNYVNFETNAVIFKKALHPLWLGQKMMANKRVAYNRGYNYAEMLDVPINVVEVNNDEQGLKVLMADRIDFLISGKQILEREAARIDKTGILFQIETLFVHSAYMGYNLSKKGTILKQEFDQQFEKLYKAGDLHKVQKKWNLNFPLVADEQ